MKQALLDRIRIINKHVTNKLMIHIAGKRFGHFAILSHTGRKSGKLYRIPVVAEPFQNGFVIALTYGKNVDWYKNVAAKGGGALRWKNKDFQLVRPVFIDREIGLTAFPALFRAGLRLMNIQDFLKLESQE
ncbi:MAG: nitroreductase family deazaflavin-dependent oxidoreductase [Anaerolineae bacterium]|mgnify:CR=1 FL=1